MRTTLDLPDPLFRELNACATLRGITLNDLLNEMIAMGLRTRNPNSAGLKRSPLPIARYASRKRQIAARSNVELQRILDEEDSHRQGNR